MRTVISSLTSAVIFGLIAGCSLATAAADPTATMAEEQITIEKNTDKTHLVLVQNGKTETYDFTAAELNDPAKLEQALAALPAEKREKIKSLLVKGPTLAGGKFEQRLHLLVDEDDVDNGAAETRRHHTKKLVIQHGADHFGLVKDLLTRSRFSKDQLQELQKIIDSKY